MARMFLLKILTIYIRILFFIYRKKAQGISVRNKTIK
jgi:hypothetical protein